MFKFSLFPDFLRPCPTDQQDCPGQEAKDTQEVKMWVWNPVRVRNSQKKQKNCWAAPRKDERCSELVLVCHRLLIEGAKKLYNPELMLIVNFSTPSLKQPSQNILNQGRVDMSNSMVKRMKLLLAELTTEPINAKGFFLLQSIVSKRSKYHNIHM